MEPTYNALLDELVKSRPRLARRLKKAEELRAKRLRGYLLGKRLEGLEQLSEYLEKLTEVYRSSEHLAPIAFLVERVRADFDTALEATLSGYQGVAADAMRDVMETEYLLLDFALHDGHLDEWLSCERRVRLRKYSPASLRERLIAAGVPPFSNEGWEPVDYRAHSESLHVTPLVPPLGARGLESDPEAIWSDAGFIEMFEHASRFMLAAEAMRYVALGQGAPADMPPLTDLTAFADAHARTTEMLVLIIALFEGPRVLREHLKRDPTSAELLQHVRNEVAKKSPRADQHG